VILRTMRPNARIVIGKNVRMSGVSICAADFHSLDMNVRRTSFDLEAATASPVEIVADVFVGANSAILKGVKIGSKDTNTKSVLIVTRRDIKMAFPHSCFFTFKGTINDNFPIKSQTVCRHRR